MNGMGQDWSQSEFESAIKSQTKNYIMRSLLVNFARGINWGLGIITFSRKITIKGVALNPRGLYAIALRIAPNFPGSLNPCNQTNTIDLHLLYLLFSR